MVGENGHDLTEMGDKVFCTKCRRRRHKKNHLYWVKTVCNPVAHGTARKDRNADGGNLGGRSNSERTRMHLDEQGSHFIDDDGYHGKSTYGVDEGDQQNFGNGQGMDHFYHGEGFYGENAEPSAKRQRTGEADNSADSGQQQMKDTRDDFGYYGNDETAEESHERKVKKPRIDDGRTGNADSEPLLEGVPPKDPNGGVGEEGQRSALRIEDDGAPGLSRDDGHRPQRDHDEVRVSGIDERDDEVMAMHEELYDEDPFGYVHLGLDDAEEQIRDGRDARQHEAEADTATVSGTTAIPPASEANADETNSDARQTGGRSEDGDGSNLVTARERRKLMIQQLAEKRKRKRAEDEAVARVWNDGKAVMGFNEFVALQTIELPPPFVVHESHQLVACGGYTGCCRCGRVVAFQGHGRFADPCRGFCPNGSVRPIRRLVKGSHPYCDKGSHLGVQWPSGESAPVPRRYRPSTT